MGDRNTWKFILARRARLALHLDVEHCSPISLRAIILDTNTPAHLLDLIAQAYTDDEQILRSLVLCPNLDDTTLAFIALTASDEVKHFIVASRVLDVVGGDHDTVAGKEAQPDTLRKKLNLTQMVQRMTVAQKIKLAMKGAKEARGLLIRDSSRLIAMGVLSNPRLTIGEVEFFAKSSNLSEEVFRKIGNNVEWSRKNSVVSALVNNPKTPVGISLGFINRLPDRELAILEKSRNIPAPVRSAARHTLAKKKLGKG